MPHTTMDDLQPVAQAFAESALARLREEYPYMKIDAVHDLAAKCGQVMEDGIVAQYTNMTKTKARISFLSLSPELRNRIYELALASIDEVIVRKEHAAATNQPALTCVSRQVRSETLPIFYGINTLVLDAENRKAFKTQDTENEQDALAEVMLLLRPSRETFSVVPILYPATRWLDAIGPNNAAMLRSVRVVNLLDYQYWYYSNPHIGPGSGLVDPKRLICDAIRVILQKRGMNTKHVMAHFRQAVGGVRRLQLHGGD